MKLVCDGCGHVYELAVAAKSLYDFSPLAYCAVTLRRELQCLSGLTGETR